MVKQYNYISRYTCLLIFTFALLTLVACRGNGSGASTTQNSILVTEAGTVEKPLDGVNSELNASTSSTSDDDVSNYVEQAYLYLEQNKRKYSLKNPRSQLTFRSEHVDNLQNKHVKFQQAHKGVPVWGREIIVHIDGNNSVYNISGEILTGISLLNTHPVIAKKKAGDVLMETNQWGEQGWKIKDIELYIFNQNSNNYLAYQLTLTKGLLREIVFMNTHDGKIIHRISGTHTTN